jgi:hypothetical protein
MKTFHNLVRQTLQLHKQLGGHMPKYALQDIVSYSLSKRLLQKN